MPEQEEAPLQDETPTRRRGRPRRIDNTPEVEEAVVTEEPVAADEPEQDTRPWGWWTVFENMDQYEEYLVANIAPDPIHTRLIDVNRIYSPEELRAGLQACTSYLSTLFALEGRLEGQSGALTKALKTGLQVAASTINTSETSVSGREAAALVGSDILRGTRKLEIDTESRLALVTGWRHAYETAQFGFSRLISLHIGESELQTDRHP